MTTDTIATYNVSEVNFADFEFVALPSRDGAPVKIFVLQKRADGSRVHFLIKGTVRNISSSQWGTNYSLLPNTADGQAIRDLVQNFETRSPYVDVATPEYKNHLQIKVPHPEAIFQVVPPFDATVCVQATFYYNSENKKAGLTLKLIDVVNYLITTDSASDRTGSVVVNGNLSVGGKIITKSSSPVEKF